MYRRQTQRIGDKLIISVRVSQSQSQQAMCLQVKRQRKRRIVTATRPQSIVLYQFIRRGEFINTPYLADIRTYPIMHVLHFDFGRIRMSRTAV